MVGPQKIRIFSWMLVGFQIHEAVSGPLLPLCGVFHQTPKRHSLRLTQGLVS